MMLVSETKFDHWLMSDSDILDTITAVYVHDDKSMNTSDHVPITISLKVHMKIFNFQSRAVHKWDRADKCLYGQNLDEI